MSTGRSSALASIVVLTGACILSGADAVVMLAGGLSLLLVVGLLWSDDDMPILMFPCLYQWSQVAVKPISSAVSGEPLNSFSSFGAPLEPAALCGFLAVASLAVGLRLGFGHRLRGQRQLLVAILGQTSGRFVLTVSVAALAAGYLLGFAAFAAPPLRQPLLALSSVKLAGLFLLTFDAVLFRRNMIALAGVIGAELVLGTSGFFASFRESLIVFVMAALCARPNLRGADVLPLVALTAGMLVVAVFWSGIKQDYRSWLNGGTGQQIVIRDFGERFGYIANEVMTFDAKTARKGFDALVERLSYIDFLAATIYRVPLAIPHQEGRQLGEALYHLVTPRFLFPDKPPVPNDSIVTQYYTGLSTQNVTTTSISIGYAGELYIDFGFLGVIVVAAVIGGFIGRFCRFLMASSVPIPYRYGLVTMVTAPMTLFETALIKWLGAVVTVILAAWLLTWLLKQPFFVGWLSSLGRERPATRRAT